MISIGMLTEELTSRRYVDCTNAPPNRGIPRKWYRVWEDWGVDFGNSVSTGHIHLETPSFHEKWDRSDDEFPVGSIIVFHGDFTRPGLARVTRGSTSATSSIDPSATVTFDGTNPTVLSRVIDLVDEMVIDGPDLQASKHH